MITGKPQIGGGFGTRYITHPLANTETDHILGQPISWLINHPERLYQMARELGISYFVVFESRLVAALQSRPDLFEETYRTESFRIFRTLRFNPIVSIDDGEVLSVTIEPNVIQVRYRAFNTSHVYVRQVYYPGWKAYVGGRPATMSPYYPNIPSYVWVPGDGVLPNYRVPFIKVEVPSGEGNLLLRYEMSTLGDTISAGAAAAITCLVTLSTLVDTKMPTKFKRVRSQKV